MHVIQQPTIISVSRALQVKNFSHHQPKYYEEIFFQFYHQLILETLLFFYFFLLYTKTGVINIYRDGPYTFNLRYCGITKEDFLYIYNQNDNLISFRDFIWKLIWGFHLKHWISVCEIRRTEKKSLSQLFWKIKIIKILTMLIGPKI